MTAGEEQDSGHGRVPGPDGTAGHGRGAAPDPPPTVHVSNSGDGTAYDGAVVVTGAADRVRVTRVTIGRAAARPPAVPARWEESRRRLMIQEVEAGWLTQLDAIRPRLSQLIDPPMTIAVDAAPPAAVAKGTEPLAIFQRCRSQMLILGAQGAGKSTLMLRVMRDLMSVDDPAVPVPVPVVLPPGHPAPDDLAAWLTRRVLHWFSGNDEGEAESLLKLGCVVPCLEGLDAVVEPALEGWATAIRTYLDTYRGLPFLLAAQEVTAASLGLAPAFTGTVHIHPLTGVALDDAVDMLDADEGHRIRDLLADNPDVREWCVTPLMLSVAAAVDTSRAWDTSSMEEVTEFAFRSGDTRWLDRLLKSPAKAVQQTREQYAVLRHYVVTLAERPSPAVRARSKPTATAADPRARSTRRFRRGLQGLAKAMESGRQEYFDTAGLLAASDPAEARRSGARFHAPQIKQDLLRDLGMAGLVLSTHAYALAPSALVLFSWSLLMFWYSQVYGGVLDAPAIRWAGRWTHALPNGLGAVWSVAVLAYCVTLGYASLTRVPVGKAALIAGVMTAAVLLVGLGAGLVAFRVDSAVPPPRRGVTRVLVRAGTVALVLGPALSTAAWWCAYLAGAGRPAAGMWLQDAGYGSFVVFTVAGGFALLRHVFDRVVLVVEYHVPWRLSAFLSAAAEHGFLVPTGGGYRFAHPTIRAAVAVALADEPPLDAPSTRGSGPWAGGHDTPERVFRGVLNETLVRREVRRALAACPATTEEELREYLLSLTPTLLLRASGHERAYRTLLAGTRAKDAGERTLTVILPLVAVWLLFGTSPLWLLVEPGTASFGALEVAGLAGISLALLLTPVWIASRWGEDTDVTGASLSVGYLVGAIACLSYALVHLVEGLFGAPPPGAVGDWRGVVVIAGAMFLPPVVAVTGYLVARIAERVSAGPRPDWAPVGVAFREWQAVLARLVLDTALARLGRMRE
ncbi:hypothetical protein JK361_04290 [Streptomyces sp. 5-8]|uniref:NACHT domain-containing protein n=1 Tax=Streptomyces musisoli TaxID=2802280 RepID=A0ABS1NUS5_9ACTN|nr:hypothetical protein [Streptomyces musisoli]MBL1103832.1 hypothetical protein [Streptomyces musisoli]